MKILFILPYDSLYKYKNAFSRSITYMPLTMIILASLIPVHIKAEIKIVDEGVEKCNYEKLEKFDIVAITANTSSAKRGYQLAEYFKSKGSYIAMGGHHVTLLPNEVAQYADSIFIGPAEKTWPQFLDDFQNNTQGKIYKFDKCDVNITDYPIIRRNLAKRKKYLNQPTVIANYGCKNKCSFCVINSFWGNSGTKKKIQKVIEDIKSTKQRLILFLDPSQTSDRVYALELYKELTKLNIHWAGLSTIDVIKDDQLFDSMVESGCVGTLIGFETLNQANLDSVNKSYSISEYNEAMQKFHKNRINVLGTFMLGFDEDTKENLLKLPEMIDSLEIDLPRFAILTPYPNTPIFIRLDKEERILSRDWSKYDSVHAVFKPKNMTPRELEEIFVKVHKECYTWKRIFKRVSYSTRGKFIALMTNIGFKIYINKVAKLLNVK